MLKQVLVLTSVCEFWLQKALLLDSSMSWLSFLHHGGQHKTPLFFPAHGAEQVQWVPIVLCWCVGVRKQIDSSLGPPDKSCSSHSARLLPETGEGAKANRPALQGVHKIVAHLQADVPLPHLGLSP